MKRFFFLPILNLWNKLRVKAGKINRGESLFLGHPLGLQTRITLLVTLIVVSVLVLFSYLDFRLTAHSQRELFRERTIFVTRELDSKIYSLKDLEDTPYLEEEIANWMYARPSIKEIDIFVFSKNTYKVQVSSSQVKDLGLMPSDLQSLKRDMVVSTLRRKEDESYWEILAPLHLGRKIIGGIRIVSSLQEADAYLAQKRTNTIFFTLVSVAILIFILTRFFSRAVNRPIQRLVRAMSEAESGQLNVEVPIRSRDEIGLLGDHFNRMLARLSQFNVELTRRIEAATRELAEKNEELRFANESLYQAQLKLVQAEKLSALGQMAATMAHEIGTPLNSISGYIQLMLTEGAGSEVTARRLKIIESQLERLTQIIRNLLQSTKQPLPKLRALHVNQLLENLISLTHPGMARRGIQLHRQLHDSLPPIAGDPELLQQVFLNLMTNAIDAMPGGGVLTLATSPLPPASLNGQAIEVVVMDNGMGMSEEVKQKAKEPFFTTKEPGEGAGLGLAICEEIIRSHHGRMEIESKEGKGSAIRVQLPVYSAEVA
ncbi:MAG: ATP-binding protein [Deltaproteobacteria bacterium]|nr:ATP-binding protein [Deltaproteobacteria bacterium]